MTALTAPRPALAGVRITFPRVVRSEWIKLTSLRSTGWSLALILLIGVGFAAILAATIDMVDGVPDDGASAQTVTLSVITIGFTMGQLVAAVLGALSLGGEYATGMVRSTFAAVPRRLPVLWAKAVVLFATVSVVGAVTAFASWVATYGMLDAKGLASPLDGELALALVGGAVYLGLVAVFALGVAAAVRSSAGSIALALGILLVLPTLVMVLGSAVEWVADVQPYLLPNAGDDMFSIAPAGGVEEGSLALPVAALVATAWTAASLAVGALVLRGRDV
ncbi:ABC transporter permease [Microbacterium paludicola]|uniref:ABC transporter permease n=1 Tax=Microbacterium paludicola TaxID=300019 RepID=UPI0038792685